MREQEQVAAFLDEHDLDGTAAFRVLDLAAEVGEIAADAAKSAEYGTAPDQLSVAEDEIGDALFSLLAVCEALDIDAGAALATAMDKYRDRFADTGQVGSGE